MEFNITEFLTPESVDGLKQLIISGLFVMATVQVVKTYIDSIVKFITKGKIKKIKSKSVTLAISLLQVIFVMFAVYGYKFNVITIWLTVMNTVILYLGTTKGFDAIFKDIKIKQENK